MLHWVPAFFLAASLSMIAVFSYLLYRRWFTFNYFFLFAAAGGAAFVFLVCAFLGVLVPGSFSIRGLYFAFSGVAYLSFVLSLLYFLRLVDRIVFQVFVGAGALVLLGGVVFFFNSVVGFLILLPSLGGPVAYSFMKEKVQKRPVLILSVSLFAAGHFMMMLDSFFGKLIFAGAFFHAAGFVPLLLLFMGRIVDMLEAVSYTSVTDGLTGVYNKHYFLKKAREAVQGGFAFAAIFSDVDNFKSINDTQGHQVGDEILKLVSSTMKEVVGEHGFVGRYGGEEIVSLITDPLVDPGEVAERFRVRVEESSQVVFPVTVSVGYAFFEPGLSAEQLIRHADEAMYKAKRRGKNRVVSYQVF